MTFSLDRGVLWLIDKTQEFGFLHTFFMICKNNTFEVVQLQYLLWPPDACRHHKIFVIRLKEHSLGFWTVYCWSCLIAFDSLPLSSRWWENWKIDPPERSNLIFFFEDSAYTKYVLFQNFILNYEREALVSIVTISGKVKRILF